MDYRIFNVRTRSFLCVRMHTGELTSALTIEEYYSTKKEPGLHASECPYCPKLIISALRNEEYYSTMKETGLARITVFALCEAHISPKERGIL